MAGKKIIIQKGMTSEELSKKINITAIEPSIEINRFRLPNKIDFRHGFFPNIVKGESLFPLSSSRRNLLFFNSNGGLCNPFPWRTI